MPLGHRTTIAVAGAIALLIAACSPTTEQASDAPSSSSPPPVTMAPIPPPVHTAPGAATPVLANVVAAPVRVRATDGKDHLAYEIQLTNAMGFDVNLKSLEVKADDKTLLSLAGDKLAYWTRVLGSQAPRTTLGPAQAGIVWLDVAIDPPADGSVPVPLDLSHSLTVELSKPMPPLLPAEMTEIVAETTVSMQGPAVIAPPLNGANWLDGDSCCDMTAHRNAMNPLDGKLWAAERYAIDYVQLQPDGRVFTGARDKPESYEYFGANIHAVADGPVVAVLDGLPEQVPGKSPTGLKLEEYGGNHIVQDIGGGNYAFYAHLKTGSVKPKVGDQLTTGQVIGLLGNSGNTDAPHLHFHVMSTPDPLRSNGLPFVFDSFKLDSRLASAAQLDPLLTGQPARLQPGFAARDEANVSPLTLDIMTYDVE